MKTHTTRFLFVIAALLCAANLQAQSSATSFYTNATAGYCRSGKDGEGKSGFAVGAAIGTIIKEKHYAEIEMLLLKNGMSYPSSKLQQIPILATYRMDLLSGNPDADGSTLQLGCSLGMVQQKITGERHLGTRWLPGGGVHVNVTNSIGKKTFVNVSLRTIWTPKGNADSTIVSAMIMAGIGYHL